MKGLKRLLGCSRGGLAGHTAVYRQNLAGDIASGWACQEQDARRDVIGCSQTGCWDFGLYFANDRITQRFRHVALDKSRRDGIHCHLALSEFLG